MRKRMKEIQIRSPLQGFGHPLIRHNFLSPSLHNPEMEKFVFDEDFLASSTTIIAPFDADADASLPPYDPEVNFLSPRPQFLHYKPKSRIERYIIEGLRFEDDLSSVNETEISEEIMSEDISSSASVAVSSVEEKSLESSSLCNQQLEYVEPNFETRPTRFGGMWNAVSLIILFICFVAVCQDNFSKVSFKAKEVKFSPLPYASFTAWQKEEVENYMVQDYVLMPTFDRKEEFMLKPPILDEEIEFDSSYDYEAGSNEFVEEFESEKLDENIMDEASVIEDDDFVVEDASFFTELENQEGGEHDIISEVYDKFVEDASFFSELKNQEGGEHDITSEVHDEFVHDFKLEDQLISSLPQAPEVIKIVDDPDIKVTEVQELPEAQLQETTADGPSVEIKDDFQIDIKVEHQSFLSLPEAPKVHHKVMTTNEFVVEILDRFVVPEAIDDGMAHQIDETVKGRFSPSIAVISLFMISVLAGTMFKVYEKQKFWIGPVEVNMMGESCPSQISSLQNTPSYNLNGNSEAQSMDKSSKRNYNRESFAASSSHYTMNSSYGSFTSYIILHSKQGGEGVVTPVRRSSRIRGKVASP